MIVKVKDAFFTLNTNEWKFISFSFLHKPQPITDSSGNVLNTPAKQYSIYVSKNRNNSDGIAEDTLRPWNEAELHDIGVFGSDNIVTLGHSSNINKTDFKLSDVRIWKKYRTKQEIENTYGKYIEAYGDTNLIFHGLRFVKDEDVTTKPIELFHNTISNIEMDYINNFYVLNLTGIAQNFNYFEYLVFQNRIG